MTLTEAVARRMKDLMEEKQFTAYKLYKEGGIAKSTISQVLNGKRERIRLATVYEMATTMGVSLEEFFADPLFKLVTD